MHIGNRFVTSKCEPLSVEMISRKLEAIDCKLVTSFELSGGTSRFCRFIQGWIESSAQVARTVRRFSGLSRELCDLLAPIYLSLNPSTPIQEVAICPRFFL